MSATVDFFVFFGAFGLATAAMVVVVVTVEVEIELLLLAQGTTVTELLFEPFIFAARFTASAGAMPKARGSVCGNERIV